MRIKDIKDYSHATRAEIISIAKSIHPQLLNIIQYRSLQDESLCDNRLTDMFNEQLRSKIDAYKMQMKAMRIQYLVEFFEDYLLLDEGSPYEHDMYYGIDLNTGKKLSKASDFTNPTYDVIYVPEVQNVVECVNAMHTSHTDIRPFWNKNSYTMYSTTEQHHIYPCKNAEEFIKSARKQFSTLPHENAIMDLVSTAAKVRDFDYPLHFAALSSGDERSVYSSTVMKSIQRHQILRDFLESVYSPDEVYYTSSVTEDGTYKFFPSNY